MKKFLFTTTACFLLIATALQAQVSYAVYKTIAYKSNNKSNPPFTSAAMRQLERKNVKAYDHFTAKYGTAVEADVLFDVNLTMIVFNDGGILTRVYYKPSGLYVSTFRYYDAYNLPENVASTIRREFGGYTVYGVTEVNMDNKTAYLVKIENDKISKTVQVLNGETTVTEQFSKAK